MAAGESRVLNVELEKAAVVFGKVLLPGGEPLADASVHYGRPAETQLPTDYASIDPLGSYRIESAGPGEGWLRVMSEGHRELFQKVVLEEGVNEIDLVLETGEAGLVGLVVDPEGEPVAGAEVILADVAMDGSRQPFPARRNPLGRLGAFCRPRPRRLPAADRKEGLWLYAHPDHGRGKQNELAWRLTRAQGRLRGAIVGLDPGQRAALRVRAMTTTGQQALGRVVDGEGYAVDGLAAGSWIVIGSVPGAGIVLAVEAEISAGRQEVERNLDFRELGAPWTAQVRQGGQPLRNLDFTLMSMTHGILLNEKSSSGRITIRTAPGDYQLGFFIPPQTFRTLPIEIGPPSDLVIDFESLPEIEIPSIGGNS